MTISVPPSAAKLRENPDNSLHYWNDLVDECAAAAFLGVSSRCLQGWRYRGGGPCYVRVSHRTIRYRRADLQAWADGLVRTSTSDPGAKK